jgi:hypothetical protein
LVFNICSFSYIQLMICRASESERKSERKSWISGFLGHPNRERSDSQTAVPKLLSCGLV